MLATSFEINPKVSQVRVRCGIVAYQQPFVMHPGHLVEALMSKVAAQLGKEGDATPFIDLSYQKISDMLHQCGYQQRGWETMYNGHTGRQLKVCCPSFAHLCLQAASSPQMSLKALNNLVVSPHNK